MYAYQVYWAVCGVGRVRVVIGGEKKMIQLGIDRTYLELRFAKLYINPLFYSTIGGNLSASWGM